MRILKIIGLILLVVVGFFLIAGLFASKDMSTEQEVVINKDKSEVYDYVKLLKNQDEYSKWNKMDPNMVKTYSGTDGTVGFKSAWKGNSDVGQGEQTIMKIEGNRIDYDLRFIEPWESKADTYMIVDSVAPQQTKVKWGFKSKMPYPMNAMGLFMNMEEALGKDFKEGLGNLKAILEK